MMIAIRLENTCKSYENLHALDSVSLVVPEGSTTVLIGPSGCGKSTILRLIIGLIQADQGSVHVGDDPVTSDTIGSLRRKMGYVIQEGGLFPHLTSGENVTLMARYLSWSPAQIHERLDELAQLTRLPQEGLGRFPAQLSGGQRQRVSLMRALMLDPQILLLDEPLGSLDPMIRAELQKDLKQIFQTLNKTVVLVTHDMGEAAYLGEHIVLMREGRVLQRGSLDDLVQNPVDPFVTDFINAQRSPLGTLQKERA